MLLDVNSAHNLGKRAQPTYLEGPAGSVLVIVADPLQLAASRKLPGDKLEAAPQQFTVQKHEELGHHSEEEKMEGWIRLIVGQAV